MGWYGTYDNTLKQQLDELKEESDNTSAEGRRHVRKLLASCFRGNVCYSGILWSVWNIKTFENGQLVSDETVIGCDLLKRDKGLNGWMYKPLGESCHPYYYNCPLKYLKMAPVACQEWRDKVIEYHKKKKETKAARDLCKSQPFYVRC